MSEKYKVERIFLNKKPLREIIEENILKEKIIESMLTSAAQEVYNESVSM